MVLRRSLGLRHATAMVVGIIIGSSIFAQPSEITRLVPQSRLAMLVWLAAGLLTLCGALVCAELSRVFPETGGVYVFLHRMFSPAIAFLWGWAMFWSMHSGIIAAIAVILARYASFFVPLPAWGVRAVAVLAVALLSWVNYLGVRPAGAVQVALTSAKVLAIAALVLLLFLFGGPAHSAMPPTGLTHAPSLSEIGLAIAAGLFAFGGWHMVTYSAGETIAPEHTVPQALVAGAIIVTACYVLLNAGYAYVLPAGDIAQSTRVAAEAAERALGTRAAAAISALVIISALGSLNGIILAGPRVYFAMARDGLAFGRLAAVHSRRQTPYVAIAAQAVMASILVLTNSYRQLFTRVVYTEWIFFGLLAAGLVAGRVRTSAPARLVAGIFALAAFAIAANQAAADRQGATWGLGLVLLGLAVYILWRQRRANPSSHQMR
ncbi:MAG: amino acid permease [Acidobacteria bacterium]|nr:amino acid permease [Acidobacteriota bacterium]